MIAAVAMALALSLANSASAIQNCNLDGPPRESGVTETDGTFAFVFPDSISRSYSGCQTQWDEQGRVMWTLRFENGELLEYAENPPDSVKPPPCRYQDHRLVSPDAKSCPLYDSLKDGIPTIPKGHVPPIPAERDPRR